MNTSVTKLTKDDRALLRKQVSEWVRSVLATSRGSRAKFRASMRQSHSWLSNRLSGSAVTFSQKQLQQVAEIVGVAIPQSILDILDRLSKSGRAKSNPRARLPALDNETMHGAGSAKREIELLLDAASHGRVQRERDLDWTSRRFGVIAGRSETLEEIGSSAGVTRERVRQVEAKMLGLASVVAAGRPLPMLTNIHARVLESTGLPWDAVEGELRPFLGGIPLREAVRFFEEVQLPDQKVGTDRASIYGVQPRYV